MSVSLNRRTCGKCLRNFRAVNFCDYRVIILNAVHLTDIPPGKFFPPTPPPTQLWCTSSVTNFVLSKGNFKFMNVSLKTACFNYGIFSPRLNMDTIDTLIVTITKPRLRNFEPHILRFKITARGCCLLCFGYHEYCTIFSYGNTHVMRVVTQEVFPQQNVQCLLSHYFYKTTSDVIVSLLYFFEESVH